MTPIHARSARSPSLGQAVDPPGLAGLGRAGPRLDQAVALQLGEGAVHARAVDAAEAQLLETLGQVVAVARLLGQQEQERRAAGSGAAVRARSATAAPARRPVAPSVPPGLPEPGDEGVTRAPTSYRSRLRVSMSARVRRPISPLQPDLAGSRSRSCVRSPREPVPTSSRSLRLRLRHPHPDRRRR